MRKTKKKSKLRTKVASRRLRNDSPLTRRLQQQQSWQRRTIQLDATDILHGIFRTYRVGSPPGNLQFNVVTGAATAAATASLSSIRCPRIHAVLRELRLRQFFTSAYIYTRCGPDNSSGAGFVGSGGFAEYATSIQIYLVPVVRSAPARLLVAEPVFRRTETTDF